MCKKPTPVQCTNVIIVMTMMMVCGGLASAIVVFYSTNELTRYIIEWQIKHISKGPLYAGGALLGFLGIAWVLMLVLLCRNRTPVPTLSDRRLLRGDWEATDL